MPSGWLPELRFVFAIREPVARDLSWFNHKMNQARMHLGPGAHSPQVRHTPLLSSGHGEFCSLGDGNVWKGYPTYEGEVRCRKQELDHCLSEARSRLSNDKKAVIWAAQARAGALVMVGGKAIVMPGWVVKVTV